MAPGPALTADAPLAEAAATVARGATTATADVVHGSAAAAVAAASGPQGPSSSGLAGTPSILQQAAAGSAVTRPVGLALEAGCPSFTPAAEDELIPIWSLGAKPKILAVAADSNVKVNRYRGAGKRLVNIKPTFSDYLGSVHQSTWCLQAEATAAAAAAAGASSGDVADLQLELEETMKTHCHPHLSCAKEQSSKVGMCDECGLTGFVCTHGQPLLGMFLAMPRAENFSYYDNLLANLLEQVEVKTFYLDTGCTYVKHWPKVFESTAPRPEAFKVPWWHAQSHGRDCYVANSGMYHQGTGRRVGENCEQLWADVCKPIAGLTRFMGKANYHDFIDDALGYASVKRLACFPELLATMYKTANTKPADCRKRVKDVCVCCSRESRHTEVCIA